MTEAHGRPAASTDRQSTDRQSIDGSASDALTTGGLVDELDLLEQQPLEERAEQLARIHDKLQAELGAVRG